MYIGFKTKEEYKEARGARLCRWKRKKVAQLSEAQGHRCAYCSIDTFLVQENPEGVNITPPKGMGKNQRATLEHIIPQSFDVQTNKDENLVMACKECNSVRSDVDAVVFYRTLHDEDFRNNANNRLMAPNKRTRKSAKSGRRKSRKAERRAKDAVDDGMKKQKLIEKEERTWALAWALTAYWPAEVVDELIVKFNTPWETRKFGRPVKIEKIAARIAA